MENQGIKDKCRNEICEVNYILQGLYDEWIYGLNGNQSRSDGTLQTNVTKMIEYLNKMVEKIEDSNGSEKEVSKEKIFNVKKGNQ